MINEKKLREDVIKTRYFIRGYRSGKTIGNAEGAIRGFIGGILFCACLYSMNYLDKIFQNPPANPPAQMIETQNPLFLQPSFQSDLSDKMEEI